MFNFTIKPTPAVYPRTMSIRDTKKKLFQGKGQGIRDQTRSKDPKPLMASLDISRNVAQQSQCSIIAAMQPSGGNTP